MLSSQERSGRAAGLIALVCAVAALVLLCTGCCYVPSNGAAYRSPCTPTACPPAGRCKVYAEPHYPYRDQFGCRRLIGESAFRRHFGLEEGAPPDPQ